MNEKLVVFRFKEHLEIRTFVNKDQYRKHTLVKRSA